MNLKIVAVALAGAFVATAAVAGPEHKLSAVDKEFKSVTVEGKKLSVSGKRTKVTIGGKGAEREQLKAGMMCKVESKDGEATRIDCK
jgi:hypothetical protein